MIIVTNHRVDSAHSVGTEHVDSGGAVAGVLAGEDLPHLRRFHHHRPLAAHRRALPHQVLTITCICIVETLYLG